MVKMVSLPAHGVQQEPAAGPVPCNDPAPAQLSRRSVWLRRAALVTFSAASGGLLLYWSGKFLTIDGFGQMFRRLNLLLIGAAVLFYWMETLARALRWHAIIHQSDRARVPNVLHAFLTGAAVNNVLPARLGDVFRVHVLGTRVQISRSLLLGSVIAERLVDLAVVMGFLLLGVLFLPHGTIAGINENLHFLLGFSVVVIAAFGLGAVYLRKVVANATPARAGLRLLERMINILQGVRATVGVGRLAPLVCYTLIIWALNFSALHFVFAAMGAPMALGQLILLNGVAGFSVLLPSAPAGLGALQFAYLAVFVALGYDGGTGVFGAYLVQLFLLGSVTLIGILLLYGVDWFGRRARTISLSQQ
jgi:glycosyltransferase 2 family protein